MTQRKIKVKDKYNKFNDWSIYGETENTYRICADCDKRFIAEIYKSTTDYIDGVLYSCEIKNIVSTMPENYMKAEYHEFWLKKGEY
jgi:hypothetical protein